MEKLKVVTKQIIDDKEVRYILENCSFLMQGVIGRDSEGKRILIPYGNILRIIYL